MSTLSEVPGSIEGEKILLTGQKITPQGRPQLIKTNILVFPITVTKRGAGTIKKEFAPREYKINPSSMLKHGDSISGTHIWGFGTTPLTPACVIKGGKGRTARHTGQEVTLTGSCYAELIHGWKGDALPVHPKELLAANLV